MVELIKDHIKKSPWFEDQNTFKHFSSYNDLSRLDGLSEEFN